mmetsp:Transcript_40745/g.95857  ORF Transcript_40745/g.95857 Transcript_40745/m.95857 type:complete len:352 (-) Transcript_40745:85-1140(-)
MRVPWTETAVFLFWVELILGTAAHVTSLTGENLQLRGFPALSCLAKSNQIRTREAQQWCNIANLGDEEGTGTLRLRGGHPADEDVVQMQDQIEGETQGEGQPKAQDDKARPKVLLGLTGSVASIKALELVENLARFANVRVLTTQKGAHFFDKDAIERTTGVQVFTDEDEWALWNGRGDPVQHIDLRRWADVLVVAPLSANTLAKLAQGLCDNLLTCTVRAWDWNKPLVVAPAMNTAMWNHPCTKSHLSALESWGVRVIPPVRKVLICGEDGVGAMASIDSISSAAEQACRSSGEHAQPGTYGHGGRGRREKGKRWAERGWKGISVFAVASVLGVVGCKTMAGTSAQHTAP